MPTSLWRVSFENDTENGVRRAKSMEFRTGIIIIIVIEIRVNPIRLKQHLVRINTRELIKHYEDVVSRVYNYNYRHVFWVDENGSRYTFHMGAHFSQFTSRVRVFR